jgi:hypothetical protein
MAAGHQLCWSACLKPAAGGSKLADVSFDGWGDKAKTPGTAVTGKTRGSNRVSFAVGVAEAGELCTSIPAVSCLVR